MNFSVQAFIEAGTIRGVHGLDGGLLLEWTHESPNLLSELERLYVQSPRGDFEPFRVLESRKTLKKGKTLFFVQFDRITDRTEAEKMRQRLVYIHPEDQPSVTVTETDSTPESVVGFCVTDETGSEWGVITSVLENPAHPILELKTERSLTGHMLIPFVEHYIPTVDRDLKQLHATHLDELILD